MRHDAAELAHRLARDAEAVCRHYLSNGRREGGYWLVGDVRNTPGRSMFVRLKGVESGKGAAGKWTDAATGEHGDLLDVIRESRSLVDFHDVADRGPALPQPASTRAGTRPGTPTRPSPAPAGSPESARRLFAMSQPITGTIVEAYLRRRGIAALHGAGNLRFHPRCYSVLIAHSPTETWPAMIAAVTDLDGKITGAHRTWLDPSGKDKAPVDTPRRAMGDLLGNAVRFGVARRSPGGRRGHRDHAVAPHAFCPPCRWWLHSRPRISPPSCSRRRSAGSTSPATTIRPATVRWQAWSTGRRRPGSRRLPCRHGSGTSTRISGHWASTHFGQQCGCRLSPEDVARFMAAGGTARNGRSWTGLPPIPHRVGSRRFPSASERTAPTAF